MFFHRWQERALIPRLKTVGFPARILVIAKLAIRPRIEQVTVALVRLREASWRRHYVIHVDGRPGMGRILGALLGAKSFEGCPVVGCCLYAAVLSCGPGEREPRQDAIKGWFQNLVFAVDEASRQWVKALEAWEAGRAALLPTGLVAPPLVEVLEKFQPEPGQRVHFPEEVWN